MKALPHIKAVIGESNSAIPVAERCAGDSAVMGCGVNGADINGRLSGFIEREETNCGSSLESQNSAAIRFLFFKGISRHAKGKKRFG